MSFNGQVYPLNWGMTVSNQPDMLFSCRAEALMPNSRNDPKG
jgi:hypothetical protein